MAESTVHILVVDDFKEWRVRVREILRAGWHVIEASDGLEAVQKATELRPDVILLDVGMPVMNGIETARQIRKSTPSSRIIFVTMNGDGDVKKSALETGAVAYLSKTQAASQLLSAIESALESSNLAISC